jgi:nicotinate-nucleotide pyrophosphorylase (carboxylating)
MSPEMNLNRFYKAALAEDIGSGDITTRALINRRRQSKAKIIAKQDGILSGADVAARIFQLADPGLLVAAQYLEGDRLKKGDQVMVISGKTASILSAERTALNFLARLSGIATQANAYIEAIKPLKVSITDTRKTTPIWRSLEKKAIRAGGGVNHRHGLFDMILIKENHIKAAGGIGQAIEQCRAYLKKKKRDLKLEIETTNLDEVRQALTFKPDRIMLDNMDTPTIAEAVRIIGKRTEVEASGGVSLRTVRKIAECGVGFISVGALTHSVAAFDFSLLLEGVQND